MSLKSLSDQPDQPPRGKSVADALGGKVGNLQAMLVAIKTVSRDKAPHLLETLFGLEPEKAREIVELLRPVHKKDELPPINGTLRALMGIKAQEKGIERPARGENPSKAMAKVIKKAASLCDRLDDLDREKALLVLRECMEATTPYFNKETEKTEERVDAKMRLAAVTLMLAYDEGLPVQRVLSGRVEMETAEETLARLRASPEAMKAIAGLQAAGVKIAIGEDVIDVEAEVLPAEKEEDSP